MQALLQATPESCGDSPSLYKLWLHESFRVFRDRLVGTQDRVTFKRLLARVVTSHWTQPLQPQDLEDSITFTSLNEADSAEGIGAYHEVRHQSLAA